MSDLRLKDTQAKQQLKQKFSKAQALMQTGNIWKRKKKKKENQIGLEQVTKAINTCSEKTNKIMLERNNGPRLVRLD